MSRFHTRQRIALLLALVISVAGLAPRPSQAAIGMPQERGWINFPYGPVARARNQAVIDGETMWVASKGAFRTDEWNEEETIYVDDNSLMLWAMSKKDYYSWSGGIYARSLRNYIISTSADGAAKLNPGNGKPLIAINPGPEFAEGHIYTTTNNLGWIPMNNDKDYPRAPDGISDSAIVSFVPSLGLVSISIAYPDHIVNNQDQSAWLRLHIARTLAHQDEIVGKTPVAVGFEDKRLRTTAIAFHMLASAMWYQHTGDATYLAYAQRAWNLIKQRQVQGGGYDKAFVEFGSVDQNGYFSVLRHEQILASMAQTFPIIGDYNGLGSALQTASNALKTVTAPVDCAGNWKIHRGFYVGPTPCADAGKGGLKFVDTATGAVWYRELIIGDATAYLGQLCGNSPHALLALDGINAGQRTIADAAYPQPIDPFFNTFAGNRTISGGLFNEHYNASGIGDEVANAPNFVGGTLEANAMVWLARWWQGQINPC